MPKTSPNPKRDKDELILTFLRLRKRGWTTYQLADRYDYSPSYVDEATRKVREADLKESGESPLDVDAGYWRARAKKRGKQ